MPDSSIENMRASQNLKSPNESQPGSDKESFRRIYPTPKAHQQRQGKIKTEAEVGAIKPARVFAWTINIAISEIMILAEHCVDNFTKAWSIKPEDDMLVLQLGWSTLTANRDDMANLSS